MSLRHAVSSYRLPRLQERDVDEAPAFPGDGINGSLAAWEQAETVPASIQNPNVPPIPPHAIVEQMTNAGKALISGDPDAWDVLKTGIRQKTHEFLPGTKDA